MPDIPIPDLDDPKEIYAFTGLALYGANLVESSLINLAVVLHLDRVKAITRQVFDATFESLEAKTLGQLLRAARTLTTVPVEVDSVLAETLEKRNYLVHGFFREHAGDITHDSGVRLMLEELRSMIALFQKADELVTPIYLSLWRKYGVDDSVIERELAAMSAEIEAKYSGL